MKIPDKIYMDFSGGVNRSKSPFTLKNNELQRGRNFEVDDQGRIKKRRGSRQFGQSVSNIIAIHNDNIGFYVADSTASTTIVYRLYSSTATNDIAIGDTSITKPDAGFTASGVIEIEGDIIDYSGGGAGVAFTGVTNITSPHIAGSSINQWQSIGTMTGHDSTGGVWFGFLNGLTIIHSNSSGGSADMSTYDGTTISAVSGEPNPSRLLEIFRDRAFVVGEDGTANTVFYSNLGDATSWPATVADNSFDIEDGSGEIISAIKQYRRNLLIFKPSAVYAYSGSLPVRQLSNSFGVFNDKCVQEVNGLLYGFGPRGVFATNGSSFVDIGEPIKSYLQGVIQYVVSSTVEVSRIGTAQFDNKFIVYVNTITEPDTSSSLTQCMFVYDTKRRTWSIFDGMQATGAIKAVNAFRMGRTNGPTRLQNREAMFFSNGSGVFRAFDDRFTTGEAGSDVARGGDIYPDMFTNTGSNVTLEVLTKPFDLDLPQYKKKFGYLKTVAERPNGANLSIVIDDNDPIPLGQITEKVQRFQFPTGTDGFRCAILIEETSQIQPLIFNGVIFEDCTTITKNAGR